MKTLITTAILTLVLASSAFARSFPLNIDTLETYLGGQGGNTAAVYTEYTGSLEGSFDITAIAFEAADTNTFNTAGGDVLFTNDDTSNWGTWANNVDLTTAFFKDETDGNTFILADTNAVTVYQLTENWVVPALNIELSAGTLLIGLNDTGSSDGDYDDLIFAATPTPIPAAAWLLGSGLIGLVGLRRSRR